MDGGTGGRPMFGTDEAGERSALLAGASIEVRPADIDRLIDRGGGTVTANTPTVLPAGMTLFVPFLPTSSFREVATSTARLARAGFDPVPHLPARRVPSRAALADILADARAAGARSVMLVAGDVETPAGPYRSTLDILASGFIEGAGFERLGFAAHPEGHPIATADVLKGALRAKQAFSHDTGIEVVLVTQFVREASPLLDWERALRADGIALKIRVGVPGPTNLTTLLAFALRCGIGASARALARRPDTIRLAGRFTPDAILEAVAKARADDPECLFAGFHLFPFGGLARTLDWLGAAQAPRAGAVPVTAEAG